MGNVQTYNVISTAQTGTCWCLTTEMAARCFKYNPIKMYINNSQGVFISSMCNLVFMF